MKLQTNYKSLGYECPKHTQFGLTPIFRSATSSSYELVRHIQNHNKPRLIKFYLLTYTQLVKEKSATTRNILVYLKNSK
ncbi:hypothetical protein BGZ63DRAFT_369857 [Mariannaea sp. PMI_226]|nr:hypothetical protein BGZ63DRAFT_369857 [Mariannaea sp. PMI_226]